ncbi:hypothetical protein ES319_A09G192000v1 [Gossypium barbadense]|uniref:Plectin/eS10 N-terminal domain-containing protein n=3 Tax=Gossypium TaxID=3633 RepID=A0A5J5UHH1_GOSBA|nr:hypothetical protein ES319_A09G192000v1 [Gossypium barbadense]TYH03386.1 hypothetical protein ES288_A09G215400v1 [Gossypium darwinii]TYI11496.1 hypothetical protein ES332_A09G211300v1 [Gossypium tomentosum]
MIIPEKNRIEICKYLFQEGVCHAKKDYNLAKHPEIDLPNLQVIKLMQSFKSKEYVRETFAWMHYYWYLTNDGIEFLRTYLNLPSEIVPATLKKSTKPPGRLGGPPGDRPRVHLALKETAQGLVTEMGTAEVLVVVTRKVPLQISSHPSGVLLVEDPLSVVVAEAIVQLHLVQVLFEDYVSFGLLVLKLSIQNLRILI